MDCVSEATCVQRFANSLDVAESVGRPLLLTRPFFDGPPHCCGFETAADPRPPTYLAGGCSILSGLRGLSGKLRLNP